MKHHLSIYCCILFLTMGMAASCNSYKKKHRPNHSKPKNNPYKLLPPPAC